jgi:hypothetical protein
MSNKVLTFAVLALLSTPLTAQTPRPREIPKQTTAAEIERQRLREQAYETVKSVWTDSRNIADARQRSDIYAQSFLMVWMREPELARAELTKNFDELVGIYSSMRKDEKDRSTIEAAISRIVSALAGRDSAAAQKLHQRYFEARRQVTGDKANDRRDLADTMNLASDILDTDLAQSVQLASQVFEKAFPENAIQYLFNLQRRDPRTAQQLYQNVLMLLASRQHYSPRSVILLSVYAFNENQLVLPGVLQGKDGKQIVSLFTSATFFEPSRETVDTAVAHAFISAAYQYLQVRVLQGTAADRTELAPACSNYFLLHKVKAYSQFYRLDLGARWLRYETAVTELARQVGATESDLTVLVQQAEKVSKHKSALSDSEDETAIEQAAEEKDQKKKAILLVNGIMWLLRQKRFANAEQSVDLLEDLVMRDQMAQVVKVVIAKDAIETHRWGELSQRIAKIEDRAMRIYLLLEAQRVIGESKANREVVLGYLSDARKSLEALDNGIQKAAGVVATLGLAHTIDPTNLDVVLNEVSKTINSAEKYQGEKYFAVLPLPPNRREFGYQLKEIGFEDSFARSGKRDWIGADLAARNLQNKYLQAWARLTAARAFLERKDF